MRQQACLDACMHQSKSSPVVSRDPLVFPCGLSRSGTTLLATILDSHRDISLGYELIPPWLPAPLELLALLDEGIKRGGSADFAGKALRDAGHLDSGKFIMRCFRAGLSEADLRAVMGALAQEGCPAVETIEDRLRIAHRVAARKREIRRTRYYGFKLNISAFELAYNLFPNSRLVYIVRDPRDVVASQIERKFDRSVEDICRAWNRYATSLDRFVTAHPDAGHLIRYEDLVGTPEVTIRSMFDFLPMEIDENVFRFYDSAASVHHSGHPNAANLKRDFFTTSIGRARHELETSVVAQIEEFCAEGMERLRYERPPT
jgi:Sulfotransferase family